MEISDVISVEDVVLDLRPESKTRLLKALAAHAARRTGCPAAEISSMLAAREKLGSTGLGQGVAIPHSRLRGLQTPYGAFVRLAAPVPSRLSMTGMSTLSCCCCCRRPRRRNISTCWPRSPVGCATSKWWQACARQATLPLVIACSRTSRSRARQPPEQTGRQRFLTTMQEPPMLRRLWQIWPASLRSSAPMRTA